MNPLLALPFSALAIVIVGLVWTGYRDRRSSELEPEVHLKSARRLFFEIMKFEQKREPKVSAEK
jgi:hypothetical protein